MVRVQREILEGSAERMFKHVRDGASAQQWVEWLRVPLEHAAAAGDSELVEKLLRAGGSFKAGWKGCNGRTLLCAAVEGGHEGVVSSVLTAGARSEVNVRSGEKRWSVLHHAASGGHEGAGRVLMIAGADPDSVDLDQVSPLHLAVRGGHEQLVGDLLLSGASPHVKDKNGETPLHIAVKPDRERILATLLLHGADVNVLDSQARSPLHLAVHGNLSATEALLSAGADCSLRYGDRYMSALDLAACHGHIDIITALLQRGVDVNTSSPTGTPLHWAAAGNQASAIGTLIEAGANIEAKEALSGFTSLHSAAMNDKCIAMETLLRNKANVDAKDAWRQTPLITACKFLATAAVDVLLRWGANEKSTDKHGRSAVDLVGTRISEGDQVSRQEEIRRVRMLLARAPADRAWRRRGLLPLCRAFPGKMHIVLNADWSAASPRGESTASSCARECRTTPDRERSYHEGEGGCVGAVPGGKSDEREVLGLREAVELRVVRLSQDCIFRHIVSFL